MREHSTIYAMPRVPEQRHKWSLLSVATYFIAVSLVFSGCQKKEPLGRVHGMVTYQGSIFSEAEVIFSNQQLGVYVTAPLTGSGEYELLRGGVLGVPPGDYQITLRVPRIELPAGAAPPPIPKRNFPDVPARYQRTSSTPLKLAVVDGDNSYDIDLAP